MVSSFVWCGVVWFGVVWKAVQLSDRVWCGSQGDFAGVVDLVKMKAIMWKSENLGTAPLLFVARVHLRSWSLRECIMGVLTRQRTQ